MAKTTQHVVQTADGGWAVKKGGSTRASKICDTQQEAIAYGKVIAKNQNAELYIHGKDGKIREKNSYGRDPLPPKDKR